MTELTQAGLITQIEQLVVPYRQLAPWFLGQSGFDIKGGATIAYIPPVSFGLRYQDGCSAALSNKFLSSMPVMARQRDLVPPTSGYANHWALEKGIKN